LDISFSATALVGVHGVGVVGGVSTPPVGVSTAAVVLFFDDPLPLAVVVVDLGVFALAALWLVFGDVDLDEEPFVDGALVVVFGALDFAAGLAFVFLGAASAFTVNAAAARKAAGSAIHLVICAS
jgi:hypothetical protein